MKFKNSYILLMAMTILLLVSIGSACASDDVSADSTQIAAADESVVQDIVGNGTDDVTPEETTQKAETSITADNNLVYNQKDTGKNITNVDVKDNESTSVENITKDNLTVTENGKNIAFDYNNSVITIKGNLEVGIHVLNITYKGNDLYNSSNILINFTIIKDNYLEVPEIVSGNTSVEIPIKLTDGVNDNTNLLNSTNTQVILKYGEGNETVAVDWSSVAATNKFTVDVTGKIPATVVINYTENGRSVVKTVKVKYQTTTQVTPTVVDINDGDNDGVLSVAQGIKANLYDIIKVKGYIVGTTSKSMDNAKFENIHEDYTAILLADEPGATDKKQLLPVETPPSLRKQLAEYGANLKNMLVIAIGTKDTYLGQPGIKQAKSITRVP